MAKKILLALLLCLGVFQPLQAAETKFHSEAKFDIDKLPQAMRDPERLLQCVPEEFTMPHPLMKGFTIRYRIFGLREGKCLHVQTMPCAPGKDCYMECRYSPATLQLKAQAMRKMLKTGKMVSDSADPATQAELADCKVHGYD